MTLEEQLRAATSKGLASLTLYAEWSSDHKTTYWTCRATPSALHGYVGVEHALDPVEAVTACLKALPGAKMRETTKAKKKITAAVTEGTADNPINMDESKERLGSFDKWIKP